DFPLLDPFLGAPIRAIGLHSPSGRAIELKADGDEFRTGRMKPLYEAMLRAAVNAGAVWSPATTYAHLELRSDHAIVSFRDGSSVPARFIAGADGGRSRIARDLGLDVNRTFITGVENVYASTSTALPRFDCWIDSAIAPGYLAWVVDDGEEIHAGVGGDRRRFDPTRALRELERRTGLDGLVPIERRGGLIPVGGVLRRIGNEHGLLVGDAAGAVSPLTAGGLDACMRLSEHAASVLLNAIAADRSAMRLYDGARFRSRFASRIVMRRGFDIATRSRAATELGFAFARTPLAMRLVRHVFFGRGSFPDAARLAVDLLRVGHAEKSPRQVL
ncbi:MAG TPA: NAD(P)/FAD-dependent oxidoreductase, partial [Thermoanaerobaculia bacterium]